MRTIYLSPPYRMTVPVLSHRRYSNTQQKRGRRQKMKKRMKRQEGKTASPVY
jgi:hypothetical protein